MHWHLTAVEGVLLGAALTGAIGYLTARTNLKGQRTLSQDQRLWERRSGLYVELISQTLDAQVRMLGGFGKWTPERNAILVVHYDQVFGSLATVYAFAAEEVLALWDTYVTATRDLMHAVEQSVTKKAAYLAAGTVGDYPAWCAQLDQELALEDKERFHNHTQTALLKELRDGLQARG